MTTKDLVHIALFAALTVALGIFPPLTVPVIGVPVTAQSMGAMLAGGILGARRGAFSMTLFLVLVAIGLPVLSGGRGGIGMFAGPSGGFLLGWVPGAYLCGWLTERLWRRLNVVWAFITSAVGGIGVLYLVGVPWIAFAAEIPFMKALSGTVIFIPGDVIKAGVAAAIIVGVKRSYPLVPAAQK
jgi:biotin transport system substrate-specific component